MSIDYYQSGERASADNLNRPIVQLNTKKLDADAKAADSELLDGKDSTAFVEKADLATETGTGTNVTMTQASITNALDQKLGITSRAADSALLEGNDSEYFRRYSETVVDSIPTVSSEDIASSSDVPGLVSGAQLASLGGDVEEAPEDGKQYARKDAGWEEVTGGGGGADLSGKLEWGYPLGPFQGIIPTVPTITGSTWTHTVVEASNEIGGTFPAVAYSSLLKNGTYVELDLSLPNEYIFFYAVLQNGLPSFEPLGGEASSAYVAIKVAPTGIELTSSIPSAAMTIPNTEGVTSFGISAGDVSGYPRIHVNGTSYEVPLGNFELYHSLMTAYAGQVGDQVTVTLDPVSTVHRDPAYPYVPLSEVGGLLSPAMYGVPQAALQTNTLDNPNDRAAYKISPKRLNEWLSDKVDLQLLWQGSTGMITETVDRTKGKLLYIHTSRTANSITDEAGVSIYLPPSSEVSIGRSMGFVQYDNDSEYRIWFVIFSGDGADNIQVGSPPGPGSGDMYIKSVYIKDV